MSGPRSGVWMRFGLLAVPLLAGCATLSGARPLPRGQTELGSTLGGGIVLLDGAPIPLPNVVLEGRTGLPPAFGHLLDVNYGLDATGLAFGLVPLHVGVDWLVVGQSGAWPALALTERVFVANNALGLPWKPEARFEVWGADQLELDASWRPGGHLFYVGLAQYFDLLHPELALTPVLGATLDPAPARTSGVLLHLEARWYGVDLTQEVTAVQWAGGGQGIFGATLGVSYLLGGDR